MSYLLVGISGAGNIIKRTGYGNSKEIVIVVIVRVSVLIILVSRVTGRNIVEIIKEGFPYPKFQRKIPLRIIDVFNTHSEGN